MFRRKVLRLTLAAAALASLQPARATPIDAAGVFSLPPAEVEARLPESTPERYLDYARRLWFDAHRDDAVFWLYVGQLRYHFALIVEPGPDPAGARARFDHLMETIGEPIERYAGADIPKWRSQIARALAWDEHNPNGYTSTSRFPIPWHESRAVLASLMTYLLHHADDIRARRAQEGIGQTGLLTPAGPYLEVRKPRMPAEWPALVPRTSLPMLTGFYDAGADASLGSIFFADNPATVAKATSFQIQAEPDDRHLRITAWKKNLVLREIRLRVDEAGKAVVLAQLFQDTDPALQGGQRTTRVTLRRNEIGSLVVQRDTTSTGFFAGKKFPVRLESTAWGYADRLPPQDEPR